MSEEEPRRITKEELKELLKKATPREEKYFLRIARWVRPGPAYINEADFAIVMGEADIIEIDHVYDYPHIDKTEYLVIPRTIPVVVRWHHYYDFGTEQGRQEVIYIFTKDGWKEVEVR